MTVSYKCGRLLACAAHTSLPSSVSSATFRIAFSRVIGSSARSSSPRHLRTDDWCLARGCGGHAATDRIGSGSVGRTICFGCGLFRSRFIWVAVYFGRGLFWPRFILAAVYCGRDLFWSQSILVAIYFGRSLFWSRSILVAVDFGRDLFWSQSILVVVCLATDQIEKWDGGVGTTRRRRPSAAGYIGLYSNGLYSYGLI